MSKIISGLSTRLIAILNVGMYGSVISPDTIAEGFYECLDEDDPRNSDNEKSFDFEKYKYHIQKIAYKHIVEEWLSVVKKFGVIDIKITGFYSPKYYNYGTDMLEFSVEVSDDFEEKVTPILTDVVNNGTWAKDYIEKHYSSRSGFISFMPNRLVEILTFKDVYCYAAAITLLMIEYGYNIQANQECFQETVLENIFYDDFCEWVL